MSRNGELIKNTVILSIGQLIPRVMAIVTLPLMTAYLSTSEYGIFDLIISVISLLLPFVTMQIQQAVFRYLISDENSNEKLSIITNSVAFLFATNVVLFPILFVLLSLSGFNAIESILACTYLISYSFYILLGQIVRGVGKNLDYSIASIIFALSNMITLVIFAGLHYFNLRGVILSFVCAYIISCTYMIARTKILGYISIQCISRKMIRRLLAFSVPIVPSSISLWVVSLSDRLIITNILGTSVNGLYSVANKVPNLFNTAYSIFNLAWTETATKVIKDEKPDEYYSELFGILYNFLVGCMLLLIASTPVLFKVLINSQYDEAYYQMPILFFGVFFSSIVLYFAGIYLALKRTKQVGYSSAIGAALNLIINLLCVHKIGLYAASISTALSYFLIALYRAWDLNKIIKIKYDFKNILYGIGVMTIASVFCYERSTIYFVLNLLVALLYNVWKNKVLITFVGKKMVRILHWQTKSSGLKNQNYPNTGLGERK